MAIMAMVWTVAFDNLGYVLRRLTTSGEHRMSQSAILN